MSLLLFALLAASADHPPEPPLTLGIVLQTTQVQQKVMIKHQDSIQTFLDGLLRPGDRAFIVAVDQTVRLVRSPTSSRAELDRVLKAAMYGNPYGTTLVDSCQNRKKCQAPMGEAVAETVKQFDSIEGRKVILVLGDGPKPGAQTGGEIAVYTVGFRGENPGVLNSFDSIRHQVDRL